MAGPNYFELVGLAPRYAIDTDELDERYRELSKDAHPDRHVNSDAATRARAVSRSIDLNKAHKALRKPATRAEHLLAVYGVDIDDAARVDATFLGEVLELREELDAALAAGDQTRLDELEESMLDRKDDILARVADAFSVVEANGGEERAPLEEIRQALIELRYVTRYLEQFDDLDDRPGEAA